MIYAFCVNKMMFYEFYSFSGILSYSCTAFQNRLSTSYDLVETFSLLSMAHSSMQTRFRTNVLKCTHGTKQFNFLPHFVKVVVILNTIPTTSCPAERSFSVLQIVKT